MTRLVAVVAVVVSLGGSRMAVGQERPDFSGRWSPVSQSSGLATLTVVHDAASLVAEQTDGATTERLRFTFSGPARQDVAHPGIEVTSVASWKNREMTATSTFRNTADGTVLSVREESWSLDPEGRLVIDVTTRRASGQTSTATRLYRKL